MALNNLGWMAVATVTLFVCMLIGAQVVGGGASPNGEVGFMIEFDQCRKSNETFTTTNGQKFYFTYPLRPVIAGELPGTACPSDPAPAGIINVSMEQEDGYRKGATYKPVFFLPNGAFAKVSFDIVRSSGELALSRQEVELGPSSTGIYPWDSVDAGGTPPAPASSPSPPGTSQCLCSNTCQWSSDGACDDGGPGSRYSLCTATTDCADCGCRTTAGRRLAEEEIGKETREQQLQRKTAQHVAAAVEAAAVTEVDDNMRPAPGSRRLLKGGSAGSRSSSSGGGRWGGSGGYTSVRAPGRSYGYGYSTGAIYGGSRVVVVRRGYYGCYGCYYGCYGCGARYSSCRSRASCSHTPEVTVGTSLDRYEMDYTFSTPAGGSSSWPLYLRVYSFDTIVDSTTPPASSSSSSAYVTFFTSDGDSAESTSGLLNGLGWAGLITSTIAFICFHKNLVAKPAKTHGGPGMHLSSPPPQAAPVPQPMPTAVPASMPTAYPGQAMPTAVPAAPAMTVAAVYHPGSMPTAYPTQQAVAYPTAYPTAYPSPPGSPPTDDTDAHDKSV